MKKLLMQPLTLAILALSIMGFGCETAGKKVVEQKPAVDIELVGEVTPFSFTVKFMPEEGVSAFDYGIGSRDDLESFRDESLPGIVKVAGAAVTEVTFTTDDDIIPNREYYVFARAYNMDGRAADVTMYAVKTTKDDFSVTEYYVTDTSAGFTVETSQDFNRYYYAFSTPDRFAEFVENPLEFEGSKLVTEDFKQTYNYFDLEPEKDYAFFVIAWNRAGHDPKTVSIEVKTYAKDSNEIPNFTIEQGDEFDFFTQNYVVTPNDKCGRLVLRQETKDFNASLYTNNHHGDLIGLFNSWKDVTSETDWFTCYQATGKTLYADPFTEQLLLDQALDVYVVAYDKALNPVSIKKFTNFKTPSLDSSLNRDDAQITDLKIVEGSVSSSGAKCQVSVNNKTRMFFFEYYRDDAYQARLKGDGYDPYTTFQNEFYTNRRSIMWGYRTDFIEVWVEGDKGVLTPGATYWLVAAPMNANGPQGWGAATAISFVVPAE